MWRRMEQSHQPRLLTTRLRTAVALALTASSFALAIRDVLHLNHTRSGLLLPFFFGLHGWPLLLLNFAFYGYLCWLAFCFIRGTSGRERTFMIGWSVKVLFSPIERLRPEWAVVIRHTAVIALTVSLFAALWLLMHSSNASDVNP